MPGCYTNDPQGTLDTLRKEVRSLNLTDIKSPDWEKDGGVDTPVNCVPPVSVIQTSPGEYGKDTDIQTDRQTYNIHQYIQTGRITEI